MPFSRHGQQQPQDLEGELLRSLMGESLQARDQEIAEEPLLGPQAEGQQVAGLFDFLFGKKDPFSEVSGALEGAEETRQQQKKDRNRGRKRPAASRTKALKALFAPDEPQGRLAPPPTPRGQEPPRGAAPQPSLQELLSLLQQQQV